MASWMITKEYAQHTGEHEAEGYQEGDIDYLNEHKAKNKFRLRDDNGNTYFEGVCGSSSSFQPLDDFGMPGYGCTEIQYLKDGEWETL